MNLKYCSLDEIGKVGRGRSKHRPRNASHLFNGPYPLIQTGDITNSDLYITKYKQTYSEAGLAQSKLWKPGVLCIVNAGVGTADNAILKFPSCFPDSVIAFEPNNKLCDIRYIKNYLDLIKGNIRSITMGATQDNLSVNKLLSFKIPIPSLFIQRKIAAVLSAYDDLIENNNCRIAILEKMAEELYREWFVRLRFPGHEKVKVVKGVPEGWGVKKIGDVYRITYGKTLPTVNIQEKGLYPVYGAGDIIGYYNIANVMGKSVLITCRGNGSGTVWRTIHKKSFVTNNSFVISDNIGIDQYPFSFYHLKFSAVDRAITGSAQPQITISNFICLDALLPTFRLIQTFNETVLPIFNLVDEVQNKNDLLKNTRNQLLSRLMSGKIDVENLDIAFPPGMEEEAT